ncbi:MAG TPA: hypothetical protein VGJ32_08490 [Solirubrobacteraceae bacterium]|jgi:hypothetical protein
MSAMALMEAPERAAVPGRRPDEPGGPTLDGLLVEVWEGLASDRAARCPVCQGTLEARYGAGAAPVAARCRDCGSELS